MVIGPKGLAIIKYFEGFHSEPYLDPIGIPTIGWGSIWDHDGARITMNRAPVSRSEATKLLRRELIHIYETISRFVSVELNQHEFDALCSFIYNLGSGNFRSSTLRQKLNRGDREGAANEFWKWRRAGGKILPGLVKRRQFEEDLFRLPVRAET